MYSFPNAANYHSYNYKLPQTWWLKTTLMYYLMVLEDRSLKLGFSGLKSRCRQSCLLSGESREESISLPFPASRAAASLGFWSLLFPKPAMAVFLMLPHSGPLLSSHFLLWLWPSYFSLSFVSILWLHWTHRIIQDNLSISRSLI